MSSLLTENSSVHDFLDLRLQMIRVELYLIMDLLTITNIRKSNDNKETTVWCYF